MEQTILAKINQAWVSPALDRAMAAASSWDLWWPVLLVAVPLLLWKGGFRERAFLACCALCILFVDGVSTNGLKKLVGSPRPNAALDGVRQVDLAKASPRFLALAEPPVVEVSERRIGPLRGGSFPSGHTANNFCIATLAVVFYRAWWAWLAYLPAAVVSYSRVYVGAHWPGDVAVSVFLSLGVTLLVLAAADFLWEKIGARRWPQTLSRHPHLWTK